jgi:hypothetical integral membrane protein (TIGR02206 family)
LTRPSDPLHSFHAFTTTHALVLVGLAFGTAVACALGVRYRGTRGLRRAEQITGFVMLALWIAWQGFGWLPANYKIEEALPLQMCDLTSLAAPLVLITRVRFLRTLLYFWGLGLSINALLTPTIEEGPLYVAFWLFWLTHAAIIGTAIYDLVAWRYRPTFRDTVIAIAACTVWLGDVLTADLTQHANYGYVGNISPDRPTAIDKLGPWPLRVYKMSAAGIMLFLAMWFPWWLVRGRAIIGGNVDDDDDGGGGQRGGVRA